MGMSAEVIAIRPYSSDIAKFLDYPEKYYSAVANGTIISCRLFGVMEGTGLSSELAALLGIDNAWDFCQHKLDPANFNVERLRDFGAQYEHYEGDVIALLHLKAAGFEFHFRPEG